MLQVIVLQLFAYGWQSTSLVFTHFRGDIALINVNFGTMQQTLYSKANVGLWPHLPESDEICTCTCILAVLCPVSCMIPVNFLASGEIN